MVCSDTRFFSELKFWVCLVGSCWHLTMWLLLEFISMSPSHSFTPYGYWFCVSSYQRKFEGTSVLRIWWPRWNGMEWNGFEWIGMESNGMDWNGMDWNGMEWHGMAQKLPVSDFEGSLARKLRFHIFSIQILREVSHESFVFTSSAFRFWGKSRTKALFPHLPLSLLEGSLARKLRFHIFNFKISGKSRTKASFPHLPLSLFARCLARKLRFHIFHLEILKEVSHESFVFTSSTVGFWRNSRTKASFSHLQLSDFEGSLARKLRFPPSDFEGSLAQNARKLRFHIFHFQILREFSHESCVITSWTVGIWRKSRMRASLSHLPPSDFEGSLARKLRFLTPSTVRFWGTSRTKASVSHLPLQILKEVSHKTHESFGFTSSTFRFWGNSRTKAAFSHLELLEFEGSLAWELRFYIFHLQISKEVSHESFAFSHLQLSDFEGSLARNACLRDSAPARSVVFCRTKRV